MSHSKLLKKYDSNVSLEVYALVITKQRKISRAILAHISISWQETFRTLKNASMIKTNKVLSLHNHSEVLVILLSYTIWTIEVKLKKKYCILINFF